MLEAVWTNHLLILSPAQGSKGHWAMPTFIRLQGRVKGLQFWGNCQTCRGPKLLFTMSTIMDFEPQCKPFPHSKPSRTLAKVAVHSRLQSGTWSVSVDALQVNQRRSLWATYVIPTGPWSCFKILRVHPCTSDFTACAKKASNSPTQGARRRKHVDMSHGFYLWPPPCIQIQPSHS